MNGDAFYGLHLKHRDGTDSDTRMAAADLAVTSALHLLVWLRAKTRVTVALHVASAAMPSTVTASRPNCSGYSGTHEGSYLNSKH